MNPYLLAFLASLCFGVVVFPWQVTLKLLGFQGFIFVTGLFYAATGAVVYWRQGLPGEVTGKAMAAAIISARLYATALSLCSIVFSRPGINIPVAATITAAYPAWTALIAVLLLNERLSILQWMCLLMVLLGVAGLTLSPKPVSS